MKTRSGFVSNSSSSSYIVLLPEGKEFTDEEIQEAIDDYGCGELECTIQTVRDALDEMKYDEIWEEEYGDEIIALSELLKKYVISEIDSGPDAGIMKMVDRNDVRRILNEEKNRVCK